MADYRIKLPVYEGPLDLLLFLIQKDELDVFDIPIAYITEQYHLYLELMEELSLTVAGEFFVMAATLMEIKSAMLLPRVEVKVGEDLEDPRAALVAQLLEYQRYKRAAEGLAELETVNLRRYPAGGDSPIANERPGGDTLFQLLTALQDVLARAPERRDVVPDLRGPSIEEQIEKVRAKLRDAAGRVRFEDLFEEGPRILIVVTFLALLELLRLGACRVRQDHAFEQIWVYPTILTS